MELRPFGASGVPVPVVGQGTWQMERDDRHACVRALRAGLDLGMTHIDTAELYGWGKVEELVGEAIEGRRDEVFLVSKVHPRNASHRQVVAACEASLRRLKTDRLDAYLLHWRADVPLEETLHAFTELQASGKIRGFGVSNFDVDDLEEAVEIVGPGRLLCNQVLYHLEERTIENAVLPWCRAHGVALVAYSPFGSGQFPGARSPGGRVLAEVGRAHGASPHQVALRFLLHDPTVLTIPKASQPDHATDNAGAGDLTLTADELARIDAAFPRDPHARGLPMI